MAGNGVQLKKNPDNTEDQRDNLSSSLSIQGPKISDSAESISVLPTEKYKLTSALLRDIKQASEQLWAWLEEETDPYHLQGRGSDEQVSSHIRHVTLQREKWAESLGENLCKAVSKISSKPMPQVSQEQLLELGFAFRPMVYDSIDHAIGLLARHVEQTGEFPAVEQLADFIDPCEEEFPIVKELNALSNGILLNRGTYLPIEHAGAMIQFYYAEESVGWPGSYSSRANTVDAIRFSADVAQFYEGYFTAHNALPSLKELKDFLISLDADYPQRAYHSKLTENDG